MYEDVYADINEATPVMVINSLFVHVARQSAGCDICRLTEESTTNFCDLNIYVE